MTHLQMLLLGSIIMCPMPNAEVCYNVLEQGFSIIFFWQAIKGQRLQFKDRWPNALCVSMYIEVDKGGIKNGLQAGFGPRVAI